MHFFIDRDIRERAGLITLDASESRHCARVLRMRRGQEIGIVDGNGTFCIATLLDVNSHGTVASVKQRLTEYGKRPFRLHLAVAPTKSIDRFEWLLEKCTECGIDEITPVICEKSERRIVRQQRLEKIILAAMKQSGRAYCPKLNPVIAVSDFLKQTPCETAMLAHCAEGSKMALNRIYKPGGHALIMIGPEGDFTKEEIEAAITKGYQAISLGSHRLRTETAAIAACIQLNTFNGLL